MNRAEFLRKTGAPASQDDMARVNCSLVGGIGHQSCGWCERHDKPRFQCGCIVQAAEQVAQ